MALTFLSGYHPRVFDAILSAVEPYARTGAEDDVADQEPFCLLCDAPDGIFLAHGREYRHYRGILTATSKPRPYKADHAPVIGWRLSTAATLRHPAPRRCGLASSSPTFERFRRTRHSAQYFDPDAAPITTADASWAIEKAKAALSGVKALLAASPPGRFVSGAEDQS